VRKSTRPLFIIGSLLSRFLLKFPGTDIGLIIRRILQGQDIGRQAGKRMDYNLVFKALSHLTEKDSYEVANATLNVLVTSRE
jgi:hypothetical protein